MSNHRIRKSRKSPSKVPGLVRCYRRRRHRPMGRTAIGPCEHTPTVTSTPPPVASRCGVSLKQKKPSRLRRLCHLAENARNLRFCYLPQIPFACLVAIPSPTGCTSQLPLSFQRFVKVFKSSKVSASTTINIRWLGWFIYAATTLTLSLPSIHRVCSA